MSQSAATCPVCCDVFNKKIYLCATGHSICEKCCSKPIACPICKKLITPSRNLTLELLVSEARSGNSIASTEGRCSSCPICAATPLSAKKFSQVQVYFKNHADKIVTFARNFAYQKPYNNRSKTENDFLIVKWSDMIFRFSVQVNLYSTGMVQFDMQILKENAKLPYVFEIDYQRVSRRDKFIGKVLPLPSHKKLFSVGSVSIPKSEFHQLPSGGINVKVYCHIREDTSIPYFRLQKSFGASAKN